MKSLIILILCFFTAGCARAPIKGSEQALRETSAPILTDDLPLQPLLDAIQSQIRFLENSPSPLTYRFGPRTYSKEEFLNHLRAFSDLARRTPDKSAFLEAVRTEFDFMEVYGRNSWGDAFFTSYYEPLLKGSRKPTPAFSTPLYKAPEDLLSLDWKAFDPKSDVSRTFRARVESRTVIPYFSRAEIDGKGALKNRKLELCWLDPIDAFFLHVQGSGTVELKGGKTIHVNYADKNGWSYEAVGQFIRDKLPPGQINLHTIENYLRSLSPEDLQKILNLNPSYVFFRETPESAVTFLGLPATDGRTIATDQRYFPKGAIAFIQFEGVSRLVLDQDIGGAITGPGRVDLFAGRGSEAKTFAGYIKHPGKLYYLVPKRR